jgi:hypothetical protein
MPSSKKSTNLRMNELSAELKKTSNLTTNDLSVELEKIN